MQQHKINTSYKCKAIQYKETYSFFLLTHWCFEKETEWTKSKSHILQFVYTNYVKVKV